MPKKTASAKKIETMLQATTMTKEEIASIAALGETTDVAQTLQTEKEIETSHEELEAETKALSLDTSPIYESTAIEINKKLSDELEECKTRYATLLDERDSLQKKVNELQRNSKNKSNDNLSAEFSKLSKDYSKLYEKYEALQNKYEREIEACKIQLEDAERNYKIYDENELNYKFEISKLQAEVKNLEDALAEKPEAQKRLNDKMQNPLNVLNRQNKMQFIQKNQPTFKKNTVPPPTNGYSSWN